MNETVDIIVAPAKSPLRASVAARLEGGRTKRSFSDIAEKMSHAERLRSAFIAAKAEKEKMKVERAKKIARATKDKRAADAVALSHATAAKLAAAEERRKARSPGASPSSSLSASPFASPRGAAPIDGPATSVPVMRLAVPTGGEPPFRLPPSVAEVDGSAEAEAPSSEPTHVTLRRELSAAVGGGDVLVLIEWIKQPSTIDLASQWLGEHGVAGSLHDAKRLLGLVYMAHDAAQLLGGEEGAEADADDQIMAREAARFKRALRRQLRRGAAEAAEGEEAFAASFERACRFHAAWAKKDVPKMAKQADEVLADLMRRVMAVKARDGPDAAPPENLLAQIKALGGDAAEAEARERFARPWEVVGGAQGGEAQLGSLEARVRATAQRALFDVIGAQVAAGEYGALWGLLDEVQRAMLALVAHLPRAADELRDRFDPAWIKQRAEAGALETADVHALMRYLVETVSGWQAPVDDAAAREWAAATERLIGETGAMELPPFIAAHLLPFLGSTIERVGTVYQRMLELANEDAEARAREAAVAEAGIGGALA